MTRSHSLVFGNPEVMPSSSRENTGNLMHGVAARRLIGSYENRSLSHPLNDEQIGLCKEKFTHIVFVAANTIRPTNNKDYLRIQQTIANNIRDIGLPIVTLGLGSQAYLSENFSDIELASETINLINVISSYSTQVACRGEFTASVLSSRGITNAIPLGCPSVYYYGKQYPFKKNIINPPDSILTKLAFNYTSFWREYPLFKLVSGVRDAYLIGQVEFFEEGVANRDFQVEQAPSQYSKIFNSNPSYLFYFARLLANNFRKFYSLTDWIAFLGSFQVSFGSRFHGNMVALQAGVPSVWFVHDWRTKELCEYHQLPHVVTGSSIIDNLSIEQILSSINYSSFIDKYEKNLVSLKSYLDTAGVNGCLAD